MYQIIPDIKKKKQTKHTRLPNGFGSITTLSGNRRNPYWARKTLGFDKNTGYPIYKTIGYYSDWIVAFEALCEYNRNPYAIDTAHMTFEEVYEKWSKRKFSEIRNGKALSKQSKISYKAAFNHCSFLYKMKFCELHTAHLQNVIDNCERGRATLENIVNLFVQLYKYAEEFNICQKNYSAYVIITKQDDDSTKRAIEDKDIQKILLHRGTIAADFTLVLLYSGMRISELLDMKKENVHLKERYMIGGNKTTAGRNRLIPIHSTIYDIIQKQMQTESPFLFDYKSAFMRRKLIAPFMKSLNMDYLPHECRHTFISKADTVGMNEVALQRIVGHASKSLTKKVYTHKDTKELLKEIEKIKYKH